MLERSLAIYEGRFNFLALLEYEVKFGVEKYNTNKFL